MVAKGRDLGNNNDFFDCLLPIRKNLLVYFNPGHDHSPKRIDVYYSPATEKKLFEKVCEIIKAEVCGVLHQNKLYLLQAQSYGGADLNVYDIKNNSINLEEHYNDDFIPVHKLILERLNTKNDKGLVLLHGPAGTGKTSYIRHLTSVIGKRMIYISPELASQISSPEFLSIVSAYPDSILVIEDAENIIEERKAGANSAVSNLLNISDDLLSDFLKIQIICSFNTDISKIDKALLREGRLIAKYNFEPLNIDKSQRLSKSLGFDSIITKEMTLAEIFNQNERDTVISNRQIGFSIIREKVNMQQAS